MSERSTTNQHRAGTAVMLGGTVFAILAVYLFQVISSRTLGPDEFAPIGVLWTVWFMSFTIAMIPAEQLVTRRIVTDGGSAERLLVDRRVLIWVFGLAILVGTGFVAATLDLFFEGNPWWIAVTAVMLLNRSVLAMARGFLAGRLRFVSYGLAAVAESFVLLAVGIVVAMIAPSSLAFAGALMISPLAVLVLRPFSDVSGSGVPSDAPLATAGASFLGFYVAASAASQVIIASGPIVVGFIGGTSAAVSIYFVTFTLFRGPITSSYGLIARVLPGFTRLADEGQDSQLAAWSRRFLGGGLLLGAFGFAAAGLIGPRIIEVLYGSEFAPDPLAAALGGAAVGFGLAALFSGQVLVGRGRTDLLAGAWIVSLAAAGATVLAVDTDAVTRVAAGFVAGELVALVMITFAGLYAARRSPS